MKDEEKWEGGMKGIHAPPSPAPTVFFLLHPSALILSS